MSDRKNCGPVQVGFQVKKRVIRYMYTQFDGRALDRPDSNSSNIRPSAEQRRPNSRDKNIEHLVSERQPRALRDARRLSHSSPDLDALRRCSGNDLTAVRERGVVAVVAGEGPLLDAVPRG